MLNLARVCCILGVLASVAMGQQVPTYSICVVEINSKPVRKGPTAEVTVLPGDVLTTWLQVRNWSANGQSMRGYQFSIDPASYTSGDAGTVLPVDYQIMRDQEEANEANAYIDKDHVDYVFLGQSALSMVDSRSDGYRWVAAAPREGVMCPEEGVKYYCGTLNLVVSDDARGVFTYGFLTELDKSQMLDDGNIMILPLDFEVLTITVKPSANAPATFSTIPAKPPAKPRAGAPATYTSIPANGSVDARMPNPMDRLAGWRDVTFVYDGLAPEGACVSEYEADDGSAAPPKIWGVDARRTDRVKVVLGQSIRAGRWTTITHIPTGHTVRIGALPGDVNNDGVRAPDDVFALIHALGAVEDLPSSRTDLNRDGSSDLQDVLDLADLVRRGDKTTIPGVLK